MELKEGKNVDSEICFKYCTSGCRTLQQCDNKVLQFKQRDALTFFNKKKHI